MEAIGLHFLRRCLSIVDFGGDCGDSEPFHLGCGRWWVVVRGCVENAELVVEFAAFGRLLLVVFADA